MEKGDSYTVIEDDDGCIPTSHPVEFVGRIVHGRIPEFRDMSLAETVCYLRSEYGDRMEAAFARKGMVLDTPVVTIGFAVKLPVSGEDAMVVLNFCRKLPWD